MNITDRQYEIIQASGRILLQSGVSGLTIKALAAEMGFVESALYRHFKSKEEIIILMIKYLGNNVRERFTPIIASDDDAVTKIKMLFESQFKYLNENRHFVIAILSDGLLDESPGIKNEALQIFLYKLPVVYALLTEAIEKKLISSAIDTDALVHFLMGGFRLMMFKWKMMGFQYDLKEEGNKMMEDFFTLITQKS